MLSRHHGSYELPSATLRHGSLVGALRRWLAVQWSWLRPRSIPLTVAFLGLVGVMAATSYLTNFAHGSRTEQAMRIEMRWEHGRLAHIDHVRVTLDE